MKTTKVTTDDLRGVFPVPPLARRPGKGGIDFEANQKIVDHICNGGLTRFLYGGNAFLYHLPLDEYRELLSWLSSFPGELWAIPSIGPSYGRAVDQAKLLKDYSFPAVMHLPCSDPRDAAGLEAGLREISQLTGTPLIVYLKEENSFGSDREAGLDAVARLVADGTCVGIKYAVVRKDPTVDPYLECLLKRVDRARVVSGIGERPAVVHMSQFKLPGFTTGSGCIAPALSQRIFELCSAGDFEAAEELRLEFLEVEDLRDEHGPARVLHSALSLAGVANTGPVSPFLSTVGESQLEDISAAARRLLARDQA